MRHVTSNCSGEKSLFNLKVSSYNSDNYGVTNSVLFSIDDPNGSLFRNFRFLVITSHADYFFGSPPSVSLPFFGDMISLKYANGLRNGANSDTHRCKQLTEHGEERCIKLREVAGFSAVRTIFQIVGPRKILHCLLGK